jgi:hypothetical protein
MPGHRQAVCTRLVQRGAQAVHDAVQNGRAQEMLTASSPNRTNNRRVCIRERLADSGANKL